MAILEVVFLSDFLLLSLINHYSIIVPYSIIALRFVRAMNRQHVITSSFFKFAPSALTWYLVGCRIRNLYVSMTIGLYTRGLISPRLYKEVRKEIVVRRGRIR
jgi:hypothetical protein